jgi:hypothetical protein
MRARVTLHPVGGCNPDGMQGRVWGYVSTERRIPNGMQAGIGKRHPPREPRRDALDQGMEEIF